MVQGFEHVEDLWVLVEELPGEGGAAARGGEQQDVLPRRLDGHPAVIAQGSPPGVLKKETTKSYKFNSYYVTLTPIASWFLTISFK